MRWPGTPSCRLAMAVSSTDRLPPRECPAHIVGEQAGTLSVGGKLDRCVNSTLPKGVWIGLHDC